MQTGTKIVLVLFTIAAVNSQIPWKGGVKYLINPPGGGKFTVLERPQPRPPTRNYRGPGWQRDVLMEHDTVNKKDSPPDPLSLDKFVEKPTGRWWLDSLARLLHNHPLHLTKYVREISIPTKESLNFETPPRLLNFPRSHRQASVETGSWPIYDQVWAVHKLRRLLSSYRQWFSPRQWKQFLQKTPSQPQLTQEKQEESVHLELLEAAVTGVRMALAECQYQFRGERWNCSEVLSDKNALFGNVLLKGVPETAFVYALVSASVVRAVSEACLTSLRNCPCNNRGRETHEERDRDVVNWQWQGCDHNIHYGRKFGRRLLDPLETGGFHIRFLMNLHNYRVGRRVVAENMQRYCRCHGTSGSCTLKTCYRRTPSMRLIGNELKAKYEKAAQVMRDNTLPMNLDHHTSRDFSRGNSIIQLNRWNNQRTLREVDHNSLLYRNSALPRQPSLLKVSFDRSGHDQRPTTQELVFYEQPSPELFCDPNPHLHILGTRGRACNSTSPGRDNCRSLCCSRGHRTHRYYGLENCECKFIWCCRVECQKCLVLKTQETCM
ncbi:unnamed protein product [Mesocestoides corti]|uniref:Protein Wnt n=3 Tax=Mesocestoides corti TaxID=53468 RepID=A0A0R3U3F0_MESCO|nr:unnamed protein product [Mesocestoides corti]